MTGPVQMTPADVAGQATHSVLLQLDRSNDTNRVTDLTLVDPITPASLRRDAASP